MPEVYISPTAEPERKLAVLAGLGDSDMFPLFENGNDDEVHIVHPEEEKWGFRITGGAEFKMPVVVFQVTEGSIAAKGGIRLGDVILKINGIDSWTISLAQARQIIEESEESLELIVEKMEDDNETGVEENTIVLKQPVQFKNIAPPRELVLPKAEPRVWHPVMWHHPRSASEENDPGQEPPHHRIIRNIRRFFKETEDKPELRNKHVEDMLLALPGASKLE